MAKDVSVALAAAIEASNGSLFDVTFQKKDGSMRSMRAKTGVTEFLRGGVSTLDAEKYLTVFDMEKREYRAINRQTIVSFALVRAE